MDRKLAAILVADVVGYSRLIERDEAGTIGSYRALQTQTAQPLVDKNGGRIVKTLGDGFIAEFLSVVHAVNCAVDIQNAFAREQANAVDIDKIVLRIGINLGDVFTEGGDLLGDGVNIAARLEPLCPPGDVLMSGSAYEQIAGKVNAAIAYVGEPHLKNISRPIKAYHLSLTGAKFSPQGQRLANESAIAVLPFVNMSEDPEQVYFGDGIAEDIIIELARFTELAVTAKASSFALRSHAADLREIRERLGAGYIVEGSVRRAGARVRISVQLVETENGTHLWAERYDRVLEDIFAVQEDIAQSVVARVAQRVIDNNEVMARRRRPEDARAYDLFLQANRFSDNFEPGGQDKAAALFEQAAQVDPSFARAYTGLAYIYLGRASESGIGVPREQDENRIRALQLAETAFSLDPGDPRVQCTLGYISMTWRDFKRAEHHLDLAKAMNPNDATILILWSAMQGAVGRPERGLEGADIACRLNPLHPSWYNYYKARLLFLAGRYEEAALLLEQRTFSTPDREPRDLAWRAASYAMLDRLADANAFGEAFVRAISGRWKGDPAAGSAAYVNWLIDVSYLQGKEDMTRLRAALKKAGI